LVRVGLSRKLAAIALWLLSATFALFAVILTILAKKYEVYFVASTAFLWALLFLGFFRTADK
jgi:hypothetical protein